MEKTECYDRKMNDQGKPLFKGVAWKLRPKEEEGAHHLAQNGEVSWADRTPAKGQEARRI